MTRRIRQQVKAILESNGFRFSERDDEYLLRFSSALVSVGFGAIGTQALITLRAPILRDIALDPARSDQVLRELNARNQESHFAKWVLYEESGLVALEYDLLGDHLQDEELMTALATLARLADHQDDLLQQKFGGARAFEQ
jgi:T3SS (YopN, CesT) and YbjN peptide-binding chaperone 1